MNNQEIFRRKAAGAPLMPLLSTFDEGCRLQGGPKKVSHYRESSLNRIKIVNQARFFTNLIIK